MSLPDAIGALRYHHQWMPDEIMLDPPFVSEKIENELADLGYKVNKQPMKCDVQAVSAHGDKLQAVSDPRGVGIAVGR